MREITMICYRGPFVNAENCALREDGTSGACVVRALKIAVVFAFPRSRNSRRALVGG